jgi:hypothetical protein
MYKDIDIEVFEKAAAEFVILNDRDIYKEYYKCAESYCSGRKDVALGGRIAIALMFGREVPYDVVAWDIYCDDAFKVGRELATYLYANAAPSHLDEEQRKYVSVTTDLKHREFTINVNARTLFKIFRFPVSGNNMIGQGEGWNTGLGIRYVPPILLMADICRDIHTLKTPNIDAVRLLCDLWGRTMKPNKNKKEGGAGAKSEPRPQRPDDLIKCHEDLYVGGQYKTIEDLVGAMGRNKYKIQYYKVPTYSPTDFQLEWYYIHVSETKQRVKLFEWANIGTYDIFPYIDTKGGKVAGIIVRLRFMLIKLVRFSMVAERNEGIKRAERSLYSEIEEAMTDIQRWSESPLTNTNIEELAPLDRYAGAATLEGVAKKKIMKLERFPPFYPAKINNSD